MRPFADSSFWQLLAITCGLLLPLAAFGYRLEALVLAGALLGLGLVGSATDDPKGSTRYSAERSKRLAEGLRDGEGHFDLARFEGRVRRAYLAIQDGWSRQQLGSARVFLSDGVAESLALRIAEQRAQGYRNPVEDVRVLAVDLLEVRHTPHFDIVSVRITVRASDYRADLATGRELPRSRRSDRFYEVWNLMRRRGACPARGDGLLEGCCPSCGAPLDGAAQTPTPKQCGSCGVGLRGLPGDWVLTKISHDLEWRHRAADSVPGLPVLRERDPGFTLEHLEDRAALLFWRALHSERTGEAAALTAVSDRGFAERRSGDARATFGTSGTGCAVCSIETRGFLDDPDWTRAVVEVRWAASGYRARAGAWPDDFGEQRPLRRTLLVLQRGAATRTALDHCLLSAHCPRCGGPVATGSREDCRYCGVRLNDGQGDWILADLVSADASEGQDLLRGLEAEASSPGTTCGGLLAWAVALVYRDGAPKPIELEALSHFAEQLELAPESLESYCIAAERRSLSGSFPENPAQARAWLSLLSELAQVDGEHSAAERTLLRTLASRSGVASEWVESHLA